MPFAALLLGPNFQLREDAGDGTIRKPFPMHSDDGFDHPFLFLMADDLIFNRLLPKRKVVNSTQVFPRTP